MTDSTYDPTADNPNGDTVTNDDNAQTPESSPSEDFEIDLGQESFESDGDADSGINLDFEGTQEAESDEGEIDLNFGADAEDEADTETDDESDGTEGDELEVATAKALDELREELRSKFGDWYVVHTYSGMENRVQQNLENRVTSLNMEDFIFEVRVPTEEVQEIRNGVKKNVKRTVLPGYVLVRMDLTDESWATVRHTPSVTGFVGHANQPIPLSLEEVEKMLAPGVTAAAAAEVATTTSGGPAKPAKKKPVEVADFDEGDSVMVVEGPFAGVHATITEINVSSQRLKALVEILGRETPVDLTFAQIQKVV
ncbi:transcription termination/antitermination protein NusG [Propionibacteriaceae bacterium Y1700]|uniref:transcription termination/antitermination protein NusG n=1 Tax=Microlunatus sp. Y1700 TaxID=3418487 RepID=UPI003DA71B5D